MSDRKRWATLALVCVACTAGTWFHANQPYLPGQWMGQVGMFGEYQLGFAFLYLVVGIVACNGAKLPKVAAPFLFLWFLAFMVLRIGPEWRLRTELAAYKSAIATGIPFGDQHATVSDGRKLTLWRWWAGGLDNAIGVVHDPRGLLDPSRRESDDFLAFRKQTGGHLFTCQALGDGFYFVTFT